MSFFLSVLAFHDINDQIEVISFSPRKFRRGIARLHDRWYRTLSLLEAVDYLQRGVAPPERRFVITFDEGYQTVYEEAFPLLQNYGMSATVFLKVEDKRNMASTNRLPSLNGLIMLTWTEIREMPQWGINFGAHILTHPDLTLLPGDRAEDEICRSKAIIEDALGVSIASFAYPFGRYASMCREIVLAHFACACSDKIDLAKACSDIYALERVDVYYPRTDGLLEIMLGKLFLWYILARSIPRRVRSSLHQGSR